MWQQSRYALSFFQDNAVPFWSMSNANTRLPDGSTDWVLSSDDGDNLVVYRKSIESIGSISMVGLTGRYSINWYNPREGGPLLQGSLTLITAGSTTVSYGDAPGMDDKDWVVLLRRV